MYLGYRRWKIVLILNCFLILSGCSTPFITAKKLDVFAKFKNQNMPYYDEFCDVLIPGKLKIKKKKTCIFRTSKFSIGVLSLEGKINSEVLINFFQKNMSNDNWYIVNSFRSKRSFILFKKESRWCCICVDEYKNYVSVEIWILPNQKIDKPNFMDKD